MGETRVAIVTGGTHGIGRACTEVLARDRYTVVFGGRDRDAGLKIADEIPRARFLAGDVTNPEAVSRLIEAAEELGQGKIHALVNNAGTVRHAPFDQMELGDWDHHLETNARSVFMVTRAAMRSLRAASGSVVNIASIAGSGGWAGLSAYTASKAAVIALTQTLAIEVGSEVRCNCICPGEIATRLMAEELADPIQRAEIVKAIPAGRFGQPHEIAEVAAFLVSDRASFVNGAAIPVDGGETAGFGPKEAGFSATG